MAQLQEVLSTPLEQTDVSALLPDAAEPSGAEHDHTQIRLGVPHVRPRSTGESERLLREARDLGPEERQAVFQQVIHDNIDLARRLAARYRGRGEPQEDLEQVANMGLVLAVLRFDPTHGVSLVDFATPTIVGELRKHFRDKCWTVRPPRRLQELRPELRRTQLELEQELHRAATTDEIAAALGLTVPEVAEIERAATGYSPVSLEHPTGVEGSSVTLGDTIPDDVDDVDGLITQMAVHTLLDSLTARQRKIVELRYFSEMTQQQIADEIGVSQVQVSRLLAQILATLRSILELEGITPAMI